MKRFNVYLVIEGTYTQSVEAEDEESAMAFARKSFGKMYNKEIEFGHGLLCTVCEFADGGGNSWVEESE